MTTVKIKGMSCDHCVKAVKRALEEIDGMKDVNVDLKKAEASFDQSKEIDLEDVKERIEKAGYEVA